MISPQTLVTTVLILGTIGFLADEPTGNLDTKSGDEILAIFEALWKQGHTLVAITHNINISERAQRVIKLTDGRIEADTIHRPDTQ